jgi:hypothetical protein
MTDMRKYKLDETLLPTVWLTWTSRDGRIWASPNGKRQNYPEYWMYYNTEADIYIHRTNDGKISFGYGWYNRDSDKIWINSGTQLYYAYAKYHKDIDRLEIAAVKYDTTRGDHKHEWSFAGDRFFIGKDKSIIDQDGNTCTSNLYVRKGWIAFNIKDMISAVLRLNTSPHFLQEFKNFIGHNYFTIGNGTSVDIQYPWNLSKWYQSKQKVRAKGKAQELTDKLVSMPLGEIEHLSYKYRPKVKHHTYRDDITKNIIYFERVNDEWSVLRALVREDTDFFTEAWRVYLNDDGTNRIVAKSDDDWVPSSQPSSWYARSKYYFANLNDAKEKCDRIKYILPIVVNDKGGEDIDKMITTLRFPEVEQLYKMGHSNFAHRIASCNTPKAEIKAIFGGYYKEKENGVLRKIGMTKYQLDKYCKLCSNLTQSWCYHNGQVLEKMRETFGNDLSHIDNATYDKYLVGLSEVLSSFWSSNYIDNLDVDKSRFWKNLIRLGEKNRQVYRVMNDTLTTYNRLSRETRPIIDWIFDSYSDLVRVHDAITELKNEQEREQRAYWNMAEAERRKKEEEKRKEVDKERKCYEYEDEDFIIRLPNSILEIVNEGTKQRICIGGYTTRHSKGETNLFFLRRKNDEETPFYAIEMNNNKNIVQIHGFGNKWLGNNPEAIPAVVRWLRKNGIKCKDTILTCKATGYGRCDDYVPMPIVD